MQWTSVMVCLKAALRVKLFVIMGNGWLRNALWHVPISCYFDIVNRCQLQVTFYDASSRPDWQAFEGIL